MNKAVHFFTCVIVFSSFFFAKAQPTLWGITLQGGDGSGVIFSIPTGDTVQSSLYKLSGMISDGKTSDGDLLYATNGKLYGMTSLGGSTDNGVLFEYDPLTDSYTKRIDFDGPNYGSHPHGTLLQASDGKLYGMTWGGGTGSGGQGVLFSYDPISHLFAKKVNFDGVKGGLPYGSLIEATNGKIYGMTSQGGASNVGVLFEYDPIGDIYKKKFDFDDTINGSYPNGSLCQASNGKLYGMTQRGGKNKVGVLFEYDPINNIYTKILDFNGTGNGRLPDGALIEFSNGTLYGMTKQGGLYDNGVIFQYDLISNSYTKNFDFEMAGNGAWPYGSFMKASNGKLFGMTSAGGTNNTGILFEYDPGTNKVSKKINFDSQVFGNGSNPHGSLTQAANGKIYGLCREGAGNFGSLFEYDLNENKYVLKINFYTDGLLGKFPQGSLLQVSDSMLYGVTSDGGLGPYGGVLFSYNAFTHKYSVKYNFSYNGSSPAGSLIQALNGKLYGMTVGGGSNYKGVIYEYDISTSTYTKKFDFDLSNGVTPNGSLVEALNGKLYGMTNLGGSNQNGVLFEYDPSTNNYSKKIDFDGLLNGSHPYGSLVEASNGKLYGTTYDGGSKNAGVIFEYDPSSNNYQKKIDLDGTTGYYPYGSLIEATDGKLYGLTNRGGVNNFGALFEYDFINNVLVKKIDFNILTGTLPYGSLMQASDGKLYGLTYNGATAGKGTLFQYDNTLNKLKVKYKFSGSDGQNPKYTSLIELFPPALGVERRNILSTEIDIFPNPFYKQTKVRINLKKDVNVKLTLFNSLGQEISTIENKFMNSGIYSFDVNITERGLYYLRAIIDEERTVKKLVQIE